MNDIREEINFLYNRKRHFFEDSDFRKVARALLYNPDDASLLAFFRSKKREKENEDERHPQRKNQQAAEREQFIVNEENSGKEMVDFFRAEDNDFIIKLPKERIPNHVTIVGPSGSGKTVCCKNLLKNEAGRLTAVVFDGSRRQLRDLAKDRDLADRGIVRVWKWHEFRLAALQPEWNTSIPIHVSRLTRNIETSFGLAASARFAKVNLKNLYARRGIKSVRPDQCYPTLKEWRNFMAATRPKDFVEKRYRATFSKALSDLIDSSGSVFDASYSEFPDELFRQGTINIIEVFGLPQETLNFFVAFVCDWIYARRFHDEKNI